jgi:DNA (cytosine-5)-methyltransferase 1
VFIDEFAGGGGASEGYHLATGRHVNFALNHDWKALSMHRMNHPHTEHCLQDVFAVDPLEILARFQGRKIGGLWLSPDCRHFSRAKGGSLLDRRVRALFWIVLKWIGRGGANRISPGPLGRVRRPGPACPRVLFLENVSELRSAGPLVAERDRETGLVIKVTTRRFKNSKSKKVKITRHKSVAKPGERVPLEQQSLVPNKRKAGRHYRRLVKLVREFGGSWVDRDISAADIGAPTIRKRLYAVARFDGKPAVFPEGDFRSPGSDEVLSGLKQPHAWVADQLDFARPCHSIFLGKAEARKVRVKRPLEEATLDRLAKGVERFVLNADDPFIVSLDQDGEARQVEYVKRPLGDAAGDCTEGTQPTKAQAVYMVPRYGERKSQAPRAMAVNRPGPTIVPTANGGSLAAISLVRTAHGERDKRGKKRGKGQHCVTEPLPSITTSKDMAMAAIHLTKFNTGSVGSDAKSPCPTITANSFVKRPGGAVPIGMVAASVVKLRGSPKSHAPTCEMTAPAHTISAQGQHLGLLTVHLQRDFGASVGSPANGPAGAITCSGGGKLGVVTTKLARKKGKGCKAATKSSLIAPSLVINTTGHPGARVDQAAHAITTGGHHILSSTFLAQHNGGKVGHQTYGHKATEPVSTISSKGSQQQLVNAVLEFPTLTPELAAKARRVARFLRKHGIDVPSEFATVGDFVIVDIAMRMLTPRELFRCQGFPEGYIIDRGIHVDPETGAMSEIDLTQTDQIRMCGNSVSPIVAAALIEANLPEMILERIAA